ncbi:MAG: GNAT family N-acetyltransferase [Geminicoccaceae bacterium]
MSDLANGYHDLPSGKLAAVATFLELSQAPPKTDRPWPGDTNFVSAPVGDLDRYRRLYRAVGRDWLWFERLLLDDAALSSILGDPQRSILYLINDGEDQGLIELDFRHVPAVELTYFGVVPHLTGRGLGRLMMDEACARAFDGGASRLWVHTCTFDHPSALGFYQSQGFRAFKRSIEIMDDPRLKGLIDRDAAPSVPLMEKEG